MERVERLLAGDVRALARCISLAEEGAPAAVEVLRRVFPHTGKASVIGITGSPGAGKSSLVDRLIAAYRRDGRKVGVIAVDPSSAFSGGSILGDRVRMMQHATDPGIFIRSMATRGHLGGLSRTSNDAVDLLDAAGYDPILVETVGVGQDEVEVVKTADAVAVVLVPGMGDDIQAIKAGILEIADLFVINKADHRGVDRLQADLDYMLGLVAEQPDRPRPAIFRTVAVKDEGVESLKEGIEQRIAVTAGDTRIARRRERAESRFRALLSERVMQRLLHEVLPGERLIDVVDRIASRSLDPYTATEEILAQLEMHP